jgi:Flp pilus assembly pilin Flp
MIKKLAIQSVRRQRGQGMTEYIIIVALIAIAAIGVFTYFGTTMRAQAAGMANELAGTDASGDIGRAGTAAGEATKEGSKNKGMASYNSNGGGTSAGN